MLRSLLSAAAFASLMLAAEPSLAADPQAGVREGNTISRFFGRLGKPRRAEVLVAPRPVPDYIRRETDREGALDTYLTPQERHLNTYDKALNVGRAIDETLFGLPQSPENELRQKELFAKTPQAYESRAGIFDGLTSVTAGTVRVPNVPAGAAIYSPPGSDRAFSGGAPIDVAPRLQDVAKLCDDPRMLANVLDRFNWAQHNTFESPIRLVAVTHPREVHYRTVGDYAYLSKRYCRATAVMSTGHHRHMVYQVIEDTGGAGGFYDRADFCVAGYDHMREHEPSCRVLRAL